MKNNRGRSLGSVILIILILILIAFLIYEVVYVDIFDIMNNTSSISSNGNLLDSTSYSNNVEDENISNTLENNMQNTSQLIDSQVRSWRKSNK